MTDEEFYSTLDALRDHTKVRQQESLTAADVKGIDDWATEQAANAVKFAEESAAPEASELWTDVVAEHGPRPVAEDATS